MNRILEFTPSQEEAVVSRVLVLVHQAMDQHLPNAGKANRQFTKTLYSDDGDKTVTNILAALDDDTMEPQPSSGAFGSYEVTSPGSAPQIVIPDTPAATIIPPPPPAKKSKAAKLPRTIPAVPHSAVEDGKFSKFSRLSRFSKFSGMDKALDDHDHDGPDWVTRVTLALLLAGLVLLAYVLFA